MEIKSGLLVLMQLEFLIMLGRETSSDGLHYNGSCESGANGAGARQADLRARSG